MPTPHILVIDDDQAIRRLLRQSLNERGYRITVVATGEAGLDCVASDPPAVVVLDLGLPDLSGLEVCLQIRSWSQIPIIILSARYDEREKVQVLDAGADDYVTKPFGTQELLARIRVAMRHASQRQIASPIIQADTLRIDLHRRQVTRDDHDIHLTPREYDLLVALATQAGRVLTHTWLLQEVWGEGYEENIQNLQVYISTLRRKVEPQPHRPRFILTEPGVGYRFVSTEDRTNHS